MANEYLDYAGLQRYTTGLKNKLSAMFSGPLVANTAAAMTDTTRIYVYTGSEAGYTTGHWYYYDGDSWEDGGVYQAAAVQTDTTLSIAGEAADAKATGDAIAAALAAAEAIALTSFPQDSENGAVASFADGADSVPMVSVVADIDPVQSFNGYDHAWAGGAGENLFENTLETKRYPTTGDTYLTYTVNDDGSIHLTGSYSATAHQETLGTFECEAGVSYILSGWPSGSGVAGWLGIYETGSTTPSYQNQSAPVTFSYENDTTVDVRLRTPATVTDADLMIYPMIRLASETDGTWAPYENICPITGRTSATITRSGKNLLRVRTDSPSSNGITATANGDGTYTMSGSASSTASLNVVYQNGSFRCRAGKSYTVSGCPSGFSGLSLRVYRSGDTSDPLATDTGSGATLTVSEDTYVAVRIRVASGNSPVGAVVKPMLRFASDTDDTFEQYKGSTYTVDLGSTVWGGSVDAVSGKLTVTHAEIASYDDETIAEPWISDRDVYTEGGTPSTGAQVVYPVTPTVTDLTPQEIDSYYGINNVWANTGDVNVTYRADTALYVAKKIAEATA